MRIFSDLHIHSRYSRATSKDLNLKNLEKYARIKGINLLGTGDFTHPEWLKELKGSLKEDGTGILRTETDFPFMLSVEISSIYTQGGKGRKIHNVILAPSFEVVDQINDVMDTWGRRDYDGRPIFGKSGIEIVEMCNEISKDIEVICAHIWTPYFGLLGSMSGFDSVEEAFGEKAKYIHALETGLSSDPEMNWRISKLDKYNLVSFSDLHSFWPWRIGREATIFDTEMTYASILKAIRTGEGLTATVEVNPAYGKYHYDGHRNCNVCMSPKESEQAHDICPVCKRKMTIGVEHRVESLADRAPGFKPEGKPNYYTLLPLSELISSVTGIKQMYSKKIDEIYYVLIEKFGSEFIILLETPKGELEKVVSPKLADLIIKNRTGKIDVKPGYDGVYGEAVLNGKTEKEEKKRLMQKSLVDFT